MKASSPSASRPPAVEEFAPDRFVIRDTRARPILSGEGELRGPIFELRSWRREGLMARLRKNELTVSTLDDQLAALPPLPDAQAAASGWRPLSSPSERFSAFSPATCTWEPVAPSVRDGRPGIEAFGGQPLRRRKARGAADFYIVAPERGGGLALRPADESLALLAAYALAGQGGPILVQAAQRGEGVHIPPMELPPPHRDLLSRCAAHSRDGWLATGRGWDLAQALLARLGVSCVLADPSS